MPRSDAATVDEYLAALPPERRAVVSTVRDLVRRHLPAGYSEGMNWGMISYEVPLERFPRSYNGQPLLYVGLAAQKNYYALHLIGGYRDAGTAARLRAAFAAAGKKLDMGKACIRFRALDDLPLEPIGEIIASTPPDALIAVYEKSRQR
jgi:hypothetical protein